MAFFSIIIPTYNRAELLRETLKSVFSQKCSDFEVVVVDDGSTDGTLATVESLEDRVCLLRQANRGPGTARNLGASKATGRYLAFLDSDDLFFPWSLSAYAQVIRSHGEPAFIAGKPKRFRIPGELAGVEPGATSVNAFPDYLSSGEEWRWWGVSSFVIRRDCFEGAGGFIDDGINGEDADLALRLGDAHGFVQVTAPCTFGYREHPTSAKSDLKKTLAGRRIES